MTSRSRSENVYASGSTYSNSNGGREYYAPEVNGNFSLENKKNKYGSLLIRSEFRYENSANRSYTEGRSFKSNPYSIEPDPNEWMGFDIAGDPFTSIRVNSTRNTSGTFNSKRMRYPYALTHTLNFSGNLQIATGWNINWSSGYDFNNKKISMTTASISRDLHCFNMSCSVVLAPYTSFNFTFQVNASTLADALRWKKQSSYSSSLQWY